MCNILIKRLKHPSHPFCYVPVTTVLARKKARDAEAERKYNADVKSTDHTGHLTFGECSHLANMLSKNSDSTFAIPSSCRSQDSTSYTNPSDDTQTGGVIGLFRRLNSTTSPVVVAQSAVDNTYGARQVSVSLGECQVLATHLQQAFGSTYSLPRSCATLMSEAKR
mmetsp:Transcript_27175/g.55623  ORF Transcript_27175/g.55623 Transcript_27175/m.55623 type:complete len:166 (-) Transcript_27175:203-700(-)